MVRCRSSDGRRLYLLGGWDHHRAILEEREAGIVRDLPGMTIWIDEHAAVSTPERLGRLTGDPGSRGPGLGDDSVDLGLRPNVVGE